MASSSMVIEDYAPSEAAFPPARRPKRLRGWLPVLVFLMVFALESTSYLGADRTSAPLRRICEALLGYDACTHWNLIHCLIRKTGHFIGYGGFALVCFRAFWIALFRVASRMGRQLQAHGLAILTTFSVASADEIHQSFVPNRWGSFSDVLLDTCGGAALCFVLFLWMMALDWIKNAPSQKDSACIAG